MFVRTDQFVAQLYVATEVRNVNSAGVRETCAIILSKHFWFHAYAKTLSPVRSLQSESTDSGKRVLTFLLLSFQNSP